MRTLRLLATFYGYYFVSALIFTIGCVGPFWISGPETLGVICWVKIGTLALTVLYISVYKKKEFYYFRNLGFPPGILWVVTMAADLGLFIGLTLLIYYIKWQHP